MCMCCAWGAPSSRPLTCSLTSAEVPLTVTQATPLPVTRFTATGRRVASYETGSAATAVPGTPTATPAAHSAPPTAYTQRLRMDVPSCPRDDPGGGSAPQRRRLGPPAPFRAIRVHRWPRTPGHGCEERQPRRANSATGSTGKYNGKYNGEHTGEDAAEPAQRRGPPGRAAGRAASGATPPAADGPPHHAGHDRAADPAAAQTGLDAGGLGRWVPRHRSSGAALAPVLLVTPGRRAARGKDPSGRARRPRRCAAPRSGVLPARRRRATPSDEAPRAPMAARRRARHAGGRGARRLRSRRAVGYGRPAGDARAARFDRRVGRPRR